MGLKADEHEINQLSNTAVPGFVSLTFLPDNQNVFSNVPSNYLIGPHKFETSNLPLSGVRAYTKSLYGPTAMDTAATST